jgi:hypothetical protein
MAVGNLLQLLLKGDVPPNVRLMMAQGSAPLPPKAMLEALVHLASDGDSEVSSAARKTISGWDQESIVAQLSSIDCSVTVLKYFADESESDAILQSVIRNSATPASIIESLASSTPSHLLDAILDNRIRLLNSPDLLKKIKANPFASGEIQRIVLEIETEFFGTKKTEYAVEQVGEDSGNDLSIPGLEIEAPPDDLSLEGLPMDPDERLAAITSRITGMSFREKVRYALFGNREIRAMLVRDSNKEISRMVLRSPKLTDNEVESIAAMRGVTEEILREIGTSKAWTRSYHVVQNLVKNPKTPLLISQNLLFRLRTPDLTLLTRDRSVPEAVRHNATRTLNQRNSKRTP